jgi:hypothetical protein
MKRGKGEWEDEQKAVQEEIGKYATPIAKLTTALTNIFVPRKYSPSALKWLEENGSGVIKKMRVRRVVVRWMFNLALNAITVGSWEQEKKNLGYDKLFHLGIILDYDLGGVMKTALLEKIGTLNFTNSIVYTDTDEYITIETPANLTVLETLNNTEKHMGDRYFTYSAFKNNCQHFIYGYLQANNLLTPEASDFILQGAEEIVKGQPGYTEDVAQALTNLGGIAKRIIEGYGRGKIASNQKEMRFQDQVSQFGLDPYVYLEEANRKAKKYNGASLRFSQDKVHKLELTDPSGKIVKFGRVGYGDYLIYSHLEKLGYVPEGYSDKKRDTFRKSHSAIKGNWRTNPYSPNNLALHILW